MVDDSELLRRYADERREDAFAELVRRHLDLVHSAALRQTNGDEHLARDVTQLVFTDLARKAASLSRHRVLAGWLFVSTRYAAAKLVRTEQRRRAREQEAHAMNELKGENGAKPDWQHVRPVLDAAMNELGETDRAAILLRYFEGRGFAEVGARLRLNENTARMRVERALAKLHGLLARRGVTSTTGALALVLAEQGVMAAPAGLAASVTGAALASGASVATAGMATFMGFTKLQLGLTGALVVGGAGGWVAQQQVAERLNREAAEWRVDENELASLRAENRALDHIFVDTRRGRDEAAEAARLRDEVAMLTRSIDERTRAIEAARRAKEQASRQRVAKALELAARHASLDMQPQVSSARPPVYPAKLRAAGIEGHVLVEFVIGADGNAHDVLAIESTHPDFEKAAEDAVKAWTFLPGIKGERPVNARMRQVIAFTLPQTDRAPGADVVARSDAFWPQ